MKKFSVFITLLVACLTSCYPSNTVLRKKMIAKYSDDQNYVTLTGEVTEFDKNNVIIKCEELRNYISYQRELCDYYIYSDNFVQLQAKDEIEFVTVPFHFYNGHKLPIVELKKDGITLLAYEEGKKNLIDWVNTNFK